MFSLMLLWGCYDGSDYPREDYYDTGWVDTGTGNVIETWRGEDTFNPTDTASDGEIDVDDLSPTALRVLDALEVWSGSEGVTWSIFAQTRGQLVQTPGPSLWGLTAAEIEVDLTCTAGDDCHPELQLPRCDDGVCPAGSQCVSVTATQRGPDDAAEPLCLTERDAHWALLYDEVTSAHAVVDVASAVPPSGRYLVALRNALARLHSEGSATVVRVTLGAGELPDADALLAELTRDLPADTTLQVHVGAWRSGGAWSHTRLVSVDSRALLVGGHDLDDASYLRSRPVHDLSYLSEGSGADAAATFLDPQWQAICAGGEATQTVWAGWPTEAACPERLGSSLPSLTGTTAGIALGRLGVLGEDPSDPALLAAIRAADNDVRISTQDLLPAGDDPRTSEVLLELAHAIARHVHVWMVLSDPAAAPGDSPDLQRSRGDDAAAVARALEDFIGQNPGIFPTDTDVHQLLCNRLHLAPLRLGPDDTWSDGTGFANHARVILIDSEAFYVGSQELIEGGYTAFGVFIDDQQQATELGAAWWAPLWENAERAAVSGDGICSF